MRVDFYQLTRGPAEAVLPLIARAALTAGERLLVVSEDTGLLERIDTALWERLPESFLGHGTAGGAHDARQPILLSTALEPANGARFVAFADGVWREPTGFERAFLLFDEGTIIAARECWRALGGSAGERHFWRQGAKGWEEVG
ncbi:MAG: DNA polymerase III subunit chi [Novosphingobium sp.]|nr:DNA polymerase III subunit chi [Novosphingobium sp.]